MTISGFPRVDSTSPNLGIPQVNPSTGELTLRVLDYGQRDLGETFLFNRAYVSGRIKEMQSDNQSLGYRWTLSFDGKIERKGAIMRIPIGGFQWLVFCLKDNKWVHGRDPGRYQFIEKRDGFQLRDFRIPAEYVYDAKGHLISIQKRGGLSLSIEYYGNSPVAVTLCGGRKILLGIEGKFLTSMKDSIGRSVLYKYEDGLLKRVVYPNNADIQYEYDDMGRLISCTDRNGKKSFLMEYDFYSRVSRLELADGSSYTYRYVDQDRRMIFLDENTLDYRTFYWNFKNQIVRIAFEEGDEEHLSYDDAGNVVYRQYVSGKELHSTYDERGLITKEEYSDGLTLEYEYDELGRLIGVRDNFDGEEQYTWNKNGWLVKKKTRLTGHAWSKEEWERDIVGRVIAYSRNGNRISYVYEGNGDLPHLMEMPCGGKFSYRYDAVGRVLLVKSHFGERSFGYNVLDLVARDTDPLGHQKEFQYNLQGDSMSSEAVTPWVFPGSGSEQRRGINRKFDYETKSEFLCTYDPKGRLTEVRRASDDSIVALFNYDIGGRVIEERIAGNETDEANLYLTRWKYDDNDNVVEERQWKNPQYRTGTRGPIYIIRNEYDAENRRVVSEDNTGERIEYEYNSLNCCITRKTRRKNQLIENLKYIYDAAGRLTGIDAKSDYAKTGKLWEHTEFVLDAEGQCLKVVYSDDTEQTGETAKDVYSAYLSELPHYDDVSGYCKVGTKVLNGKTDER